MLQNTSLRIKRFITQQQFKSFQNLGYETDSPRFSEYQFSDHGSKRSSWLSESPSAENIINQRSISNETLGSDTHHPETAHSSMSSLCSCDCRVNPVPIEQSLSRVESYSAQQEVLYSASEITNNASGNAKPWRTTSSGHQPRLSSLSIASASRLSTRTPFLSIAPIDTINVFSIPEFDNDKTPTQSIKYITDLDMEDLSANVEQLIRETDEAFKAVGTALAEAKAVTGWYDTGFSPVQRPILISRGIMRQSRSSVPIPVPVPRHRSPITKPKPKSKPKVVETPRKSLSVKKKKSTLFNKTKSPKLHVQNSATGSRWNLNDVTANMVDVFSGRRFRMEADEMLTPMRIQKLKDQLQIAAAENERRISEESSRSDASTGTTQTAGNEDVDCASPTEPFHLEELSERIDAVNRAGTPPSIIIKSPTPTTLLPPVFDADTSTPSLPKQAVKEINIAFPFPPKTQSHPGMIYEDFSFPAPPPIPLRNPRRISSLTKGLPLLPTIPEISPLSLSPTPFLDFLLDHSPSSLSTPIAVPISPPNYTLLPSTKYSLLSPGFQHGKIRIEKSPGKRKEETLRIDEQEKVDWVAFQMAISGNMDEFVGNERSDSDWELDEVEIDEIVAWWENFRFGIGGLIDEQEHIKRTRIQESVSQVQNRSSVETSPSAQNSTPGPEPTATQKELEHLTSTLDSELHQEPAPPYQLQLSTPPFEAPIFPAPPPPQPEATDIRRPSTTNSMPPSPMLDLGALSPEDEEVIPMGFNLGHDLGDFLRWETNHVGVFYE